MSLQHLKYTLEEINVAADYLRLENCDFYKRCVTRIIALRVDDFYRLGFQVNKSLMSRNQRIKDELNALKELYKENLKLQRDKFGAHFQYLDLGVRLETWSSLDLVKANFFSEIPDTIYDLYASAPGYLPVDTVLLSADDLSRLELVNAEFDIEKYPNISSDILALTRPNSGGLIHFSHIQHKAGVLKSLELLINYELEVLEALENSPSVRHIFLKLFIVDLMSYIDNFYTRSDIQSTDPQYEPGLDCYLTNNIVHYGEANRICNAFKINYKVDERINELRPIRNKLAGHIDPNIPVNNLAQTLQQFDQQRFVNLYQQLKSTFRKICFSDITLTTFTFDPFDRLHGVTKMIGMPIKTFDGGPEREVNVELPDVNDDAEYERQVQKWIITADDEIRSYFYNCSLSSNLIDHVSREVVLAGDQISWVNYEYRKVHGFFEKRLIDSSLSNREKISLIELMTRLGGTSYAWSYILADNYPTERDLQKAYVTALGHIMNKPLKTLFNAISTLYRIGNFYEKYESLMAIYRIDLEYRRSIHGNYLEGDTIFSVYLKSCLKTISEPWIKFTFALALAGEYIFGRQHLGESFKRFYFQVFEYQTLEALNEMIDKLIKGAKDKRAVATIRKAFFYRRHAQLIGLLAEFLEKRGQKKIADNLFGILYERLVPFAMQDISEIRNYAVACFKRKNVSEAIRIARYLIQDNAYQMDDYFFLFKLYLQDRVYEADFIRDRQYVIDNFNLTIEQQGELMNYTYE